MNKQKALITAAYYASFIAMGFSMASLGPTLPGLAENTRSSLSAISILFAARSLGSLLGSVWGGRFYDRQPGHKIMALSIVAMSALTLLTPFAPLLWLLTAILFVTGVVQGFINIGGNAMLVWVHGPRVGPFMNALHFCFGVGTFITPVIIAQFVGRQGGMLWIYLLLAVLILPTAVVALLPSPASPHSAQQNAGSRTDPLLIILLSAVFGLYSGAGLAYSGWIFTYATNLNLTNATNAAYLTSIYWGGLTLGRLAAIPLAIRFSPRAVLRADFLGALLSLFIFLLWPRSITAIIIAAAGLGFSLASIYPTTMSLAGQLMTVSGKVTGLFSIGNSAGSMIVPWVVGQFFESAGPQSMILVLIVDVLLALGVLAMLARRSAPRVVVQGV